MTINIFHVFYYTVFVLGLYELLIFAYIKVKKIINIKKQRKQRKEIISENYIMKKRILNIVDQKKYITRKELYNIMETMFCLNLSSGRKQLKRTDLARIVTRMIQKKEVHIVTIYDELYLTTLYLTTFNA